jgi:hypothetical protein
MLAEPRQPRRHDRVGVVGFLEVDEVHAGVADARVLGSGAFEAGNDEAVTAIRPGDEEREPFELQGVVAGQVAQVRAGTDEQRVDAGSRHGRLSADERGGRGCDHRSRSYGPPGARRPASAGRSVAFRA